ncbi:hypothetical protein [Floridanema flaviceps]|uniref:hypothetical protein n=1 Tax=Floridanema flaviceps TaxID=3396170 RepID=UPI0039A76BA9
MRSHSQNLFHIIRSHFYYHFPKQAIAFPYWLARMRSYFIFLLPNQKRSHCQKQTHIIRSHSEVYQPSHILIARLFSLL